MGIGSALHGKLVFLDTSPFIYYMEDNERYGPILNKLFKENSKGILRFQTSVITLLEVLVQPFRLNEHQLIEEYQKILLHSRFLDVFDVNIEIVKMAAKLRAEYGFKTPDSIQLATAMVNGCDYFLTNDIK